MVTITTSMPLTMAIITDLSLLRLLQISSVSLPIGGFAFSHGLETATESGWVSNAGEATDWLRHQLTHSLAWTDFLVLRHAIEAALDGNDAHLEFCNQLILACRETRELKLTDTAMGESLLRVLRNLNEPPLPFTSDQTSFVIAFGWACSRWGIKVEQAILGYAWSWLENQVAAATKLVPLGQTQAQQCLVDLQPTLLESIELSAGADLDDVGASLPAVAIASSLHETQYTRLFRS